MSLREHVREHLSEARVERQWSALEAAGLPGPARGGRRTVWVIAPLFAAAVLAGVFLLVRAPAALPAGALVESERAEVSVRFEDGSQAFLAPRSRLSLRENGARRVRLELREGSARFEVAHVPGREFEVKAGPAEVRVVGTRFSLAREQRAGVLVVRLSVSQGVVEVRRSDRVDDEGGELRKIRAGESWSAEIPERAREQVAEPEGALAVEPEPSEHEPIEAAEDKTVAKREPVLGEAQRAASEVWRQASVARRAGRMQEAAQAYAELVARHPQDPRAGLSAFELGRIRMDALSDAQGAIEALERSLSAGPSASFHEDALARIVIANDALGRTAACQRARERYLASYPSGVHAHALLARCR